MYNARNKKNHILFLNTNRVHKADIHFITSRPKTNGVLEACTAKWGPQCVTFLACSRLLPPPCLRHVLYFPRRRAATGKQSPEMPTDRWSCEERRARPTKNARIYRAASPCLAWAARRQVSVVGETRVYSPSTERRGSFPLSRRTWWRWNLLIFRGQPFLQFTTLTLTSKHDSPISDDIFVALSV